METKQSVRQIYTLFVACCLTLGCIAQTQQGEVKTRGRMENGVLKPGKGLAGATVYVAGRQAVQSEGDAGRFSFPVTGQKFRIEKVQKQGYQLIDYSVCTEYRFSDNPLRLVMETPEQQQSDLLAAERKIRRNLQRQLQQKENEIEALQVSQQEKDSLLRILYQQQTDNEKLIADMAKRYSTLDYDQLDEFYRQVSWFIENGELTRADSLLRTRGDINTQVQDILKQGQAIKEKEAQLAQAKSVQQAEIAEAAMRCYAFFESFQQYHAMDSAAHYLELRAALDTTNIEWQEMAGTYIKDYIGNYPKALSYYQLALRQSIENYGEKSSQAASAYNRVGITFRRLGDYSKALEFISKSLNISEEILGTEHLGVGIIYDNLGTIYADLKDYDKAFGYHRKALLIHWKVLGSDHPSTATVYSNIAAIWSIQGANISALNYYSKALAIEEKEYGLRDPRVATTYNNIGIIYSRLHNYSKALEYYTKSIYILTYVYRLNHPYVATTLRNVGVVYECLGDFTNALKFYNEALSISEKVYGKDHPKTKEVRKDIEDAKSKTN